MLALYFVVLFYVHLGTSKEREVYNKTIKQNPTAQKFYSQMHKTIASDVRFTLESINSVSFGSHFNVNLGIEVKQLLTVTANFITLTFYFVFLYLETYCKSELYIFRERKEKQQLKCN